MYNCITISYDIINKVNESICFLKISMEGTSSRKRDFKFIPVFNNEVY